MMIVQNALAELASLARGRWLRFAETSPARWRLLRGALWSLVGAVLARGSVLLASLLLARMLGKGQFGEFGMIQSTVGMFGVFAGFGMGVTLTKHIAEWRAKDPARIGRVMKLANLLAC